MTFESAPTPRCFDLGVPPFRLEAGPQLPQLPISGWWWGPVQDQPILEAAAHTFPCSTTRPRQASAPGLKRVSSRFDHNIPTVLFVHALTGDARAGGEDGWWAPLIGPGRPFDPACARLLCFNNLGSCYGSFGPTSPDWPWMKAPVVGEALSRPELKVPAAVSTWDQARAILRALDALGIGRIRVALGGSLGGMIVLALAALAPDRFEQLVPIAASVSATPWIIGFNHIARQAILADPGWPTSAHRGLSIARQLGQMTYRAEAGLVERQGRRHRPDGPPPSFWSPHLPYAQETYLEHQGEKFIRRFDARSYLVQLNAMDHHDIDRKPPEPEADDQWCLNGDQWSGRSRLPDHIDAVGISSDVLYRAEHMQRLAASSVSNRYHEIQSPHGHDGFLIEWTQLETIFRAVGAPFNIKP